MNSALEESLANLEDARKALRAAVETVPGRRRPNDPASLVGQRDPPTVAGREAVLRHHRPANQRSSRRRSRRRTGKRRTAGELNRCSTIGRIDANAPEAVSRAARWTMTPLGRTRASRAGLRGTVEAAEGLALSLVTHNHPIFGTLNVYQLMDFIAGHEMRHAKQIAGIAEAFA